jgi:hypothetical protein
MSTTPPPPEGAPGQPSYAEENAMRIASENITSYDEAADTYHCSYGPPIPAATIHDPERGLLVRVEPRSRQVVGFTIPNFKAWYAEHATEDGAFEVELPPVWPVGGAPAGEAGDEGEAPAEGAS